MEERRNRPHAATRSGSAPDTLSGRTVGRLDLPGQFVPWALRVRLGNELWGREGPELAHGFHLAFGLARCEPAREAFERAFTLLFRGARRDLALAPPCCACVSCDEEELLRLFHPKTPGATRERLARALVMDVLADTRAAEAAAFAGYLAHLEGGGVRPASDPDTRREREMRLSIGNVLTPEECADIRARLARTGFVDGRTTAGWHARLVKENEQARHDDPGARRVLDLVRARLLDHPVFVAAARPRAFAGLLLSRYRPGMHYGRHVDDALMGGVRTDLSFTLFLSEPDSYEGGALVIEEAEGEVEVRLPAGWLYLYPSTTLHRVDPVTRGERLAVVGWVRSFVRDPLAREILFDLETARRLEFDRNGKSELFDLVSKSLANLLRRWAED